MPGHIRHRFLFLPMNRYVLLSLVAALSSCSGEQQMSVDTPADASVVDASVIDASMTDAREMHIDARITSPFEDGELNPGGDTTVERFDRGAFVQAAGNLSVLRRADFEAGLQFFQLPWVPAPGRPEADGLGPTFNAIACTSCHVRNGRGIPPKDVFSSPEVLLRLGSELGPDPNYGGQLQPFGVSSGVGEGNATRVETVVNEVNLDGEIVTLTKVHYEFVELGFGPLDEATDVSPRLAQQLVGQGLLESIPNEVLIENADPDDADDDGISGRVARLQDGTIGRFGWKAIMPTVKTQSAAAFFGDMGLTTSLHPNENCPPSQNKCASLPNGGVPEVNDERLRVTSSYVRLLGVPGRRITDRVQDGKLVFNELGCSSCHTPSFRTGEALEPELSNQTIWPYSDLLLHDMGAGLADGVAEGAAKGNEWRTPPLWGLGLVKEVNGALHLLHDGRASSYAEAVLWHGGEAESAKNSFIELSKEQRRALYEFLDSL